jgi:membrane protein implicated in regulation of membrane protease activity
MPTGHVLLVVLLTLVLMGVAALVWWDIIEPRKRRRVRRQERRENRALAKIRGLVLGDIWNLRGRRRLTDQRSTRSQGEEEP